MIFDVMWYSMLKSGAQTAGITLQTVGFQMFNCVNGKKKSKYLVNDARILAVLNNYDFTKFFEN